MTVVAFPARPPPCPRRGAKVPHPAGVQQRSLARPLLAFAERAPPHGAGERGHREHAQHGQNPGHTPQHGDVRVPDGQLQLRAQRLAHGQRDPGTEPAAQQATDREHRRGEPAARPRPQFTRQVRPRLARQQRGGQEHQPEQHQHERHQQRDHLHGDVRAGHPRRQLLLQSQRREHQQCRKHQEHPPRPSSQCRPQPPSAAMRGAAGRVVEQEHAEHRQSDEHQRDDPCHSDRDAHRAGGRELLQRTAQGDQSSGRQRRHDVQRAQRRRVRVGGDVRAGQTGGGLLLLVLRLGDLLALDPPVDVRDAPHHRDDHHDREKSQKSAEPRERAHLGRNAGQTRGARPQTLRGEQVEAHHGDLRDQQRRQQQREHPQQRPQAQSEQVGGQIPVRNGRQHPVRDVRDAEREEQRPGGFGHTSGRHAAPQVALDDAGDRPSLGLQHRSRRGPAESVGRANDAPEPVSRNVHGRDGVDERLRRRALHAVYPQLDDPRVRARNQHRDLPHPTWGS